MRRSNGFLHEFTPLRAQIEDVLKELTSQVSQEGLERKMVLGKQLAYLQTRLNSATKMMQTLLSNDEDMANMFLSEKIKGTPRATSQHNEAEMLLEGFMQLLANMSNETAQMRNAIEEIEDYINIHLDNIRNQIMRFNLVMAVLTFAASIAAVIAALFGMNLHLGTIATDPNGFYIVSFIITVVSLLTIAISMIFFKLSYRFPFKINKSGASWGKKKLKKLPEKVISRPHNIDETLIKSSKVHNGKFWV